MKLTNMTPVQQLDVVMRARYPVIWIASAEETRVQDTVVSMVKSHPKHNHKQVFTWTCSKGICPAQDPGKSVDPKTTNPMVALQYIANYGASDGNPAGTPSVWIFKDLAPFFKDPRVARAFRDVLADLTSTQKTLVVIDQSVAIPESAKRQVALIEWPLPTIEELVVILDEFVASLPDACPVRLNGDREEVAKALQGLTHFQASSVLATAAIANGVLDHTAVDFIVDEKARLIKESGLVEFYQPDESLEIGGLDLLQTYFAKRRRAFSDEAQQFGLDTPKGALLVGVPGCGKSLAAKVLSKLWNMPLIRLDVGALMGSLVGQSEANLRQALAIAEGAAPAVLWIDEIEKGLSGVASSGHTDGGTTSRVFGQMLTWMQEKTAPVYIIATSNDISGLPPELLRAGRFDKIFFVDIPNPAERAEIWSIHLERRGRKPADFDLSDLVDASDGYTGSEIEQAVMDALVQAFDQDRKLDTEDLAQAIGDLMPLTQTMGERIADLRAWAERRASRASTPVATEATSPTASRARGIDF